MNMMDQAVNHMPPGDDADAGMAVRIEDATDDYECLCGECLAGLGLRLSDS